MATGLLWVVVSGTVGSNGNLDAYLFQRARVDLDSCKGLKRWIKDDFEVMTVEEAVVNGKHPIALITADGISVCRRPEDESAKDEWWRVVDVTLIEKGKKGGENYIVSVWGQI